MIKDIAKKAALKIPQVKNHVDHVRELHSSLSAQKDEIESKNTLISHCRSPGLFSSSSDFFTERLLSHPAGCPLPNIHLGTHVAEDKSNRIEVADRLITAYHKAIDDEPLSPLQREGEDLWTGLLRNELPELLETIEYRDAKQLAHFLQSFGTSFVWFGGITTCIDGYNRNLDPHHVALTYYDKLVAIAEYLGVIRLENPESGPWGDNLHLDPSELIVKIEDELRISITPPLGIIHTDGLQTNKGLFHYRHIQSLYSATVLTRANASKGPICEFGGGLGITSMYARSFGHLNYTILDLPITSLLAGHYLIHAVGDHSVSLYGEEQKEKSIKLLPYWECQTLADNAFTITVNQDSMPEIADNLIMEYLRQIKRTTRHTFLSINHECAYPRTVNQFVKHSGGFNQIYRTKCWVREGYLEEMYSITKL